MDQKGVQSMRPIRNRRINSRRSWSPSGRSGIVFGLSGHRHTKKLFTPDIKRSLKKWLVERRENPYPNRQEKKELADSTGLTYIQICNWFANWRRKLKNTGDGEEVVEDQRRTWNQLIRSYNDHAKGNVEQLPVTDGEEEEDSSICENEKLIGQTDSSSDRNLTAVDWNNNNEDSLKLSQRRGTGDEQDLKASEGAGDDHAKRRSRSTERMFTTHQRKYKKSLMEKYFQDEGSDSVTKNYEDNHGLDTDHQPQPHQLMKWIESTAKFTPDKFNYTAWEMDKMSKGGPASEMHGHPGSRLDNALNHQFEELEAAEALAHLSLTYKG